MAHAYVSALAFAACLLLAGFSGAIAHEEPELKIEVLAPGTDCSVKAADGMAVSVHYKGSLLDGTVFDSSHDRGEPFEFVLGDAQVIPGWEQGLEGACMGEKRKLTIPSHLGYGEQGMGPIPAGATLIFETEVVGVRPGDFEGGEIGGESEYSGYTESLTGAEGVEEEEETF